MDGHPLSSHLCLTNLNILFGYYLCVEPVFVDLLSGNLDDYDDYCLSVVVRVLVNAAAMAGYHLNVQLLVQNKQVAGVVLMESFYH